MAETERELLAAADLTIVTAPRLIDLKGPAAKNIAWVPNGVDYRAFQQAVPLPLPATAGPILGYGFMMVLAEADHRDGWGKCKIPQSMSLSNLDGWLIDSQGLFGPVGLIKNR